MSRRKTDNLGDLAAGAAAGRRVVASVGQLDGAFLAALQRVNLAAGDVPASTWGDGVTSADNPELSEGIITSNQTPQCQQEGANDGA